MSAKFFLDTNILVYTFDERNKGKKNHAISLVREALPSNGCISWQVVQEFCNVALTKFVKPMPLEALRKYQSTVLFPLCRVWPTQAQYRDALAVKVETGYGWYDSLALASALHAGVRIFYSEDLQHGRTLRHLKIVNPFEG